MALLGTAAVFALGWLEDEPARPERGLGPIPTGTSLRESAAAAAERAQEAPAETGEAGGPLAAAPAPEEEPDEEPRGDGEYEEIDFELLNSFEYATAGEAEVEEGEASDFAAEIPEEVLDLDGVPWSSPAS